MGHVINTQSTAVILITLLSSHLARENNHMEVLPLAAFQLKVNIQRFFRCSCLNLKRAQVVMWEAGRSPHYTLPHHLLVESRVGSFEGKRQGLGLGPPSPELFLNS